MSRPQVSVLIPVYNGKEFIRDSVNAALEQRDVAVEVIVIDDGSTDETPQILAEYGDKIVVLRQKNGGHVNARNNGAKIANGEWLAFLDADDLWRPEKLARQLALARPEVGMVYTDRENFGDTERVKKTGSADYALYNGDIFEPLLMGNFIPVASVMIRRDWFDRLGGFDESLRVVEDWDMWFRFSSAGGITEVVRDPLTLYRWHAGSMTNNQERMCHGRLLVLERALKLPRAASLSARIINQARANVWKCNAWHAAPWKRSVAAKWYLNALWYWPWDFSVYKQIVKCCLPLRSM
jgi:glycosyltransferase involved in cell wall biosynthesis